MADVGIDPFEEHELRPDKATNKTFSLTPKGGSFVTRAQVHLASVEQETSFGGEIHGSVLHKEYLVGEIYELIGNKTHQKLEPNLSLFKLGEDGRLYYKGKPLMNRNGELKVVGVIANTLCIKGLLEMGYNITKTHLKPRFVLDLKEKTPSSSDIAKADEIQLQEIVKSMEDLIFQINNQSQTDALFENPLHELLGLDKQLRSIRGSLKVEAAKGSVGRTDQERAMQPRENPRISWSL